MFRKGSRSLSELSALGGQTAQRGTLATHPLKQCRLWLLTNNPGDSVTQATHTRGQATPVSCLSCLMESFGCDWKEIRRQIYYKPEVTIREPPRPSLKAHAQTRQLCMHAKTATGLCFPYTSSSSDTSSSLSPPPSTSM
jgi:hypothetical protein